MEASTKDCCQGDCDGLGKERLNYFTGRHLAARDFRDEQHYHRSHRFLHNRMLHGWGVVCGLEVREHKQEDCRDRYVEVTPGMAIDCCGREIMVDCAICCGEEQPEIPWKDYRESHPWLLLCLSYADIGIEPVPVLSSEGDCSTAKTDPRHGRYREGWKLQWQWVSKSDLEKYSWKNQYGLCPPAEEVNPVDEGYQVNPQNGLAPEQAQQQGAEDDEQRRTPAGHAGLYTDHSHTDHPHVYHSQDCPHDDCGDPCSDGFRSCTAPRCPPHHCVPLALICVKPREPVVKAKIVMRGRPEVPYSPQKLTHITKINWPHGGIISPRWLEHNNRLIVTFDRKLRDAPDTGYPGPSGVNPATFVVQFGEQYEDLDFAPYAEPPSLIADGLKAEYQIAPRQSSNDKHRQYRHESYDYLEGHTLWISLKCDFVLDCHGVRVDGNNDGIAGGTFESWVSVVDNEEYERLEKEGRL